MCKVNEPSFCSRGVVEKSKRSNKGSVAVLLGRYIGIWNQQAASKHLDLAL